MDEYDKLNVKLVKNELVEILESGNITDPQMQYTVINKALREINQVKDKKTSDIIIKYFQDQEELQNKINEKQKELQKLVDEYSDNVKEIYDNMIKKL